MDRVVFAAMAGAAISLTAIPSVSFAETSQSESITQESQVTAVDAPYTIKMGADMWWGSTKVDNTRRGWVDIPSIYIAYQPTRSALPDMSYRYTAVDGGDFVAFDKHDLSFYYNVVSHKLMTFDVGLTATQYTGSHYRTINSSTQYDFNDLTVNLYSYAEIKIPETEWHIIGQFEVGNMNGIKSTDFMAGIRYQIPFDSMTVSLRGGYRVIDLEFSDLAPASADLSESLVFVDGYFFGTEIRF
ncbi:TIGR04219 family outer membrane beta-barrel protein [Vibrio marisflavi]|uniref:Outer membrane protein n=1 Tax=Vibrio marisflavi CECT 7928 TaxID=634439 RepID=A0ABN8EBD0_9VIBR|nr:TIGR04219 family outer membrane beta-barrel protein [Vibrio marisflavi]CAH0542949.1 hypothetical protein VMF7928_04327 [Vibrio marisflavi CECT 7928]